MVSTMGCCFGKGRGKEEGRYLLGHDDVEVVLCLVDVRTHRHDTAHAGWVRLARPRARRVHDADFRASQEIRRATESVQHPRSHDAGAVGVRVDVYLDGRIHSNHAQSSDDLRRVGHLLGP